MDLSKQARCTILISVVLAAVTVAAFWPVIGCDFTSYDDPDYVTRNAHVTSGLDWRNVAWAFKAGFAGNWHPATWLSHMGDCQFYGLSPWGHHLTNLLFHITNSLLLFGLFRRLTHAVWPSAFVAALFAVHPLHVESVAWVAERKDVLSTFFFMLSLWAYVRYVQRGMTNDEGRMTKAGLMTNTEDRSDAYHGLPTTSQGLQLTLRASGFYLLALFFFSLGLMSKPMLVTMPFVLLLLDFWPLGRLTVHSPQSTAHSPQPAATRSMFHVALRLVLEKLPFLGLSAASCVVTFLVQRDAGAVAPLAEQPLGLRLANALISYVRYIFKMMWPAKLAVFYPTPGEWPSEWVVGAAVGLLGISALAILLGRKAPWFAFGWFWYVGTLVPVIGIVQVGSQAMADRYSYIPLIGLFVAIAWGATEAWAKWTESRVWLATGEAAALVACGVLTWQQTGYWRNSTSLFEHALVVTSGNFVAHYNLGTLLMEAGDPAGAERHFAETVRLKPYDAPARASLAAAQASQHETRQAIEQYRQALRLQPDFPEALNNLAWILAANPDPEVRNGPQAVILAERACKLTDYKRPLLVGTLAAAYAEAGRFEEAVVMAEKAQSLAQRANQSGVAARNRAFLELYRSGQPARDTL